MISRLLHLALVLLILSPFANAQSFIKKEYAVKVQKNLIYGVASNFLGNTDTLKLDLYKPLGCSLTNRPILVLIHGGAWLGGDKSDASLVQVANEFAQRGYITASVNYRLGMHSGNWAANVFPKNVNAGFHAAYIADSAEAYRALFRAIQDIKGAIRFMKQRYIQDSSCHDLLIVGGESAGGFNALSAVFLDRTEEKPASCYEISDVSAPQTSLLDNYPNSKVSSQQLKRPDLGSVEGYSSVNGYNAKAAGVFNLFGGLHAESISKNWIHNQTDIPIYLTHQKCDGIVPCEAAKCLSPLSTHCNLGYTPFHTYWPLCYGSCALHTYFKAGSKVTHLKTELFNCDPILFPLTDCIRFANNGSYHYTVNVPARVDTMALYFYNTIYKNFKNCSSTGYIASENEIQLEVFPNPNRGHLNFQLPHDIACESIAIYTISGAQVPFDFINKNQIQLPEFMADQLLILVIKSHNKIYLKKVDYKK